MYNKIVNMPFVKRFPKASLAVFLVICVLSISCSYALLSATSSKDNMFAMGQLSVALYEDDQCFTDAQLTAKGWTRGQYDWYDHDTGELTNDLTGTLVDDGEGNMIDSPNGIPDFADAAVCGAPIYKTPYVENTSDGGAVIFISVGIPTESISKTIGTETSINAMAGTQYKVKVTGYAFQQSTDNMTKKQMWDIYSNSNSTFKNMRTNNIRVGVFKITDPDTGENGKWEFIEQFNSTDNYNYYVYAYKNILPGTEQEGISDPSLCVTTPLFTTVTMTGFNSDAYAVAAGKLPVSGGNNGILYLSNSAALDNDPSHRLDFTSTNEISIPLSEGATLTFKRNTETKKITPYIYFADGNALIGQLYVTGAANGLGGDPWNSSKSGVPGGTSMTFENSIKLVNQFKITNIYSGATHSNTVYNSNNYNNTVPPQIALYCTEPNYGGMVFVFGFTRMLVNGNEYYVDYANNRIFTAQGSFYTFTSSNGNSEEFQKWLSACITSGMLIGDFWFA